MAGYQDDFSMSNNARKAKDEGLKTASEIAKIIKKEYKVKCTAGDVKNKMRYVEWHHTSSKFNSTDFYSVEDISGAIDGIRQAVETRNSKSETIWTCCKIKWLEWTKGIRRPVEKVAENCAIINSHKAFLTIIFPSGKVMKKKHDANGFDVDAFGLNIFNVYK